MKVPMDDLNLIKGSCLTKCRFLIQDSDKMLEKVKQFEKKEPITNEKLKDWVAVECNKRHFPAIPPEDLRQLVYILTKKYFILGFNAGKETYSVEGGSL